MKKLLVLFIIFIGLSCLADQFVPEFNKMKLMRCEVQETLYNQDNSVVSKTQYHRIFRLDDENNKIYLQKVPVDWPLYYGEDKIKFIQQPLADDYMMTSRVEIDRINNTYTSETEITYDNDVFGQRHARAEGVCKIIE